ncbi:DMT family transporter [Syntrophomonas erecta]
MNPYYIGVLLVLASATGFALMPIFAIYAYQDGVTTISVLFLRFFFASLFFFLFILIRKERMKIDYSVLIKTMLIGGVFYMIQSILYFSSVHYIPASMVALLFYAYPALVALFSFLIEREALSRTLLIAVLISFAGLILVLGASFGTINKLGMVLALGAALVYAIYIIASNRLVKEMSPMVSCAFVCLFASYSLLITGLVTNTMSFFFPARAWLPVMGIVLLSTVLAIFGLFKGLELIGSTRSAILSMIEPPVTVLFSCLLFQDKLSLLQWMGAVLVIFGSIMVTKARETKSETSS